MRQALAAAANRAAFGTRFLTTLFIAAAVIAASAPVASANSKYAAIVIDAKTGKTLFARNADERRYPASLTKMMTLYLVFEALASGQIRKDSRVTISQHAASEPPSKVGIKPGGSITVEEGILALVTKSANDVATALGEFLGGSEARFAQMMTSKARALGMGGTVFRNAHGLPNNAQYTTARDMAVLGIALREHFPQYYGYFSAKSAVVAGKRLGNHNRLLGRVAGVDGIKTGYIRASGFNLVSSVQSGGRSIVATVMGGQSGRSRDDHMVALIGEYLPKASRRGGEPLIAARETIKPTQVLAASAGSGGLSLPRSDIPTPDSRPADMVASAYAEPARTAVSAAAMPGPRPSAGIGEEIGEGDIDITETSSTTAAISGWVIQIASTGSESEALDLLARTAAANTRVLSGRTPFTEQFVKGGVRYHRARYAGFSSKDAAWDACGELKKRKVACYAVVQ